MPPVVVVSHGLWQRRFGGDPALVGRTLEVDGPPMTVTAAELKIHAPSSPPVKTVLTPLAHEWFGPSRTALADAALGGARFGVQLLCAFALAALALAALGIYGVVAFVARAVAAARYLPARRAASLDPAAALRRE